MTEISPDAMKQLFSEARTYTTWLPQSVDDQLLHAIYEQMKWGPTSANLCPARIIFVRKPEARAKLIATLVPQNVSKVEAAPVTAIIAYDEKFYEYNDKLYPQALYFKDKFADDKEAAYLTAFRNGSLQGAYFILSARAHGLDCGPMSGFDNKKLDEAMFAGTSWKSNFICNIGYGDKSHLHPRLPRLSFAEACEIL